MQNMLSLENNNLRIGITSKQCLPYWKLTKSKPSTQSPLSQNKPYSQSSEFWQGPPSPIPTQVPLMQAESFWQLSSGLQGSPTLEMQSTDWCALAIFKRLFLEIDLSMWRNSFSLPLMKWLEKTPTGGSFIAAKLIIECRSTLSSIIQGWITRSSQRNWRCTSARFWMTETCQVAHFKCWRPTLIYFRIADVQAFFVCSISAKKETSDIITVLHTIPELKGNQHILMEFSSKFQESKIKFVPHSQ